MGDWGIRVSNVVSMSILEESMVRAIERQAEAEQERPAKVINIEGEFQAAQRLKEVTEILVQQPQSLQLRYMQTLMDLASDRTSTIVFQMPINLLKTI